jgi:hypothetical protein
MKQLRLVIIKHSQDLATIIAHERATRHGNKEPHIWKAVEKRSDLNLALTMVVGALHNNQLSRRPSPAKWYARIGAELGFEGAFAVEVGMWASKLPTQLPIFPQVLNHGGLEIRLDLPEVQALIHGAINYLVTRRPQLLPLKDPPSWAAAGACDVVTDAEPAPDAAFNIDAPDIVTHHPSVAEQLAADIAWGCGRNVVDALDWLQGTPFIINQPILELIKREPIHDIPPKEPKKPPGFLKAKDEKHYQASLKRWMRAYSKWLNWHWMIGEAEILSDWDAFYNILKLDFRGRLVVLQSFAYQQGDAYRALFLLKNGAPIGEDGILWLKAHVAARASGCSWSDILKPDRLNLEGRTAWTDRHYKRLVRIGRRILAGERLEDDDLPPKGERYQFAAACVELAQVDLYGPTFVTHLPLVHDASCSGLQHIAFALLSEDPLRQRLPIRQSVRPVPSHRRLGAQQYRPA